MRLNEIENQPTMTDGRKSVLDQGLTPNPFHNSKITQEMYHGSRSKGISHLNRPNEGIWFAEFPEWCRTHYAGENGEVYVCWINVKNPYYPTDDEVDDYYGEMETIGEFFNKLKKEGYDAYIQGGESGSIAVFESVQIVNALTGKIM